MLDMYIGNIIKAEISDTAKKLSRMAYEDRCYNHIAKGMRTCNDEMLRNWWDNTDEETLRVECGIIYDMIQNGEIKVSIGKID